MQHTEIIAEIGNTHEGSLGLAKAFIKAAADCGVDRVKFQTHIFDAESLPDAPNPPYFKDETRKEYFDRTGFSLENWRELKRYSEEECGVGFMSSPFSLEAVDLLEAIEVDSYKVASGEVSNTPLLEKLAQTGKKIYLSSGMSSWDEIDEAVEILKKGGGEVLMMQCTSDYPCKPENAGLGLLKEMAKRYQLPVGFSDHTLGLAVPIAAVAAGACVVEKHFTLSKVMYGPDAQFSVTPEEMTALVKAIRDVEKALASEVNKDEKAAQLSTMKTTFEKSIVSVTEIPAGTVIGPEHLGYKKPGLGIPAAQFRKVIGKVAAVDIENNIRLSWDMLESEK
ncbi:N-acetylneuraminate synthase family protein [Pseudodesulfovibrio sp. zrk46]|uniref:N-acetylneuraminate synthase family protein n=1 Tax=Pseudodesulfovibrio sp. zrk46 TaxID=2725288 RepID=UPI001449DB0B|nr:N-acetylneuraminate synthase family protein [Pseudodesulfovibrio sp. zrk46]QJB56581.1 N-acetylneuraminate synthase [Pseudodesulfovibrio sp. zrk46]